MNAETSRGHSRGVSTNRCSLALSQESTADLTLNAQGPARGGPSPDIVDDNDDDNDDGNDDGNDDENDNNNAGHAAGIAGQVNGQAPVPIVGLFGGLQAGGGGIADDGWKEWLSWRLRLPWLLFHLVLTVIVSLTIAVLAQNSRANSGFVRLGSPPSFLSNNPDLLRAIWTQGLQYTTLPTFLMTLYRTVWDGIVAAVAERQPFVELRRPGGGPPGRTVLLDYRAESLFTAPSKAFRTGHYLLAACMATSVWLALLAIPGTAFLFTTHTSGLSHPITVGFTSELNFSVILNQPLDTPSVRLALEWAAASELMRAPPLLWTNGTSAYPAFTLPTSEDVPASNEPDRVATLRVESTAHFAKPSCVALREGLNFTSEIYPNPFPGQNSVAVILRIRDRGCDFRSELLFSLREPAPPSFGFKSIAAKAFAQLICRDSSTRLAFAVANYTGNRVDKHTFANLSVVSCVPRYWSVPGLLNATLAQAQTSSTPSGQPAIVTAFEGDWSRAVEATDPGNGHLAFETGIVDIITYDQSLSIQVPTPALSRYIWELSSSNSNGNGSNNNTDTSLNPESLRQSMTNLLEKSFAALAATTISTPLPQPINRTALVTVAETRIIVVEPVAYFIISSLSLVAVLLVGIIFSVRRNPSALFEEPVGILSVAGIAQRSAHLTEEIKRLDQGRGCKGKFRQAALGSTDFMETKWHYHETERHIYDVGRAGRLTT